MTKSEKPNADASKPDAKKADAAQQSNQAQQAPSKSKGLIKYLLFGVAGLGLMGGAIFVTLMLLGDEKGNTAGAETTAVHTEKADVKSTDSATTEHASVESTTEEELLDSLAEAEVVDPIEQLVQNIEVMNAEADSNSALQASNAINEDSVKELSWIEKQKTELAQRESALATRQKALEELDRTVSKKVTRLEQSLADRVANLAKLYDGMEPVAVAKLAENLDDSIVVALIPRMKQKNASQLLSLMPPQRAAKLSKQIITLAGE